MTYYLFLDTETLGLDPGKHSLVEAAFTFTDENLEVIKSTIVRIFPPDGVYHVDPKALAVNGIDLLEHSNKSSAVSTVREWLIGFLSEYKSREVIPVGWNVGFDLGFIHKQLISKEEWDLLVGYRNIDLCSVTRFLLHLGKLESAGSLVHTAKVLGIEIKDAHTSIGDVNLTIEVMKRLKEKL